MTSAHPPIFVTTVLLVALTPAANAQSLSDKIDSYAERNGEAEARADLRSKGPIRLYSHAQNGRAPGFRTPGLSGCNLNRYGMTGDHFLPLPEADWSEGVKYTAEQQARAASAVRFAIRYNHTMFRAKKTEILRFCPKARLAD